MSHKKKTKNKTGVLAVISLLSTLPAFGKLQVLKGNHVIRDNWKGMCVYYLIRGK